MGLIWLLLAGIVVWGLVRLGRLTEGPRRGHWRITATLFAAVMLAGGLLALTRSAWLPGVGLIGAGLWLVFASRSRTVAAPGPEMSDAEARSILGVGKDADAEAVNAAWRRLMARAHPDQGGTEGLAARLNAARDRLSRPERRTY